MGIFEEFSGWMKEKRERAFRVKTLESPWLGSKVLDSLWEIGGHLNSS
jgi:hypothetical protein